MIGDQFDDAYVPVDAADDELAAYDQGRFLHYREVLRVVWLNAEESARVKAALFGS